jgi:hypothetical protein
MSLIDSLDNGVPSRAITLPEEFAPPQRRRAPAVRPGRRPVFRARLLRLDAEEHVLLMAMHHVAGDGWSLGVLFRELAALCEAYRDGRESPLADRALQYGDYAAWERGALRDEVLDRQLDWWKEQLAGAPTLLELPTDRARPAVQTYRGSHQAFELLARLEARRRRAAPGPRA